MMVKADMMDVTVTGTAFAVDYEPHGTCICCLHGDVHMTAKAAGPDPKEITPEHMCLIYRQEVRDPKTGGLPERHAVPLRALEERAHGIWPQAAPH
jgi:ferric-dicitrate binding protein FerR (iron transport regulator)